MIKKINGIIIILLSICLFSGCEKIPENNAYGVFLSIDNTEMEKCEQYQTIIIDAAYFTKEDITNLKANGHTVYSYLNVGAIENFRSYYIDFNSIRLGKYENWDEEYWMDVSNTEWGNFLVNTLAKEFVDKGIDGFFIDNCDVYYQYPKENIYQGLVTILEDLMKYQKDVVINGGDNFVLKYASDNGKISSILTGVNQETVFSKINFEKRVLETAEEDSHTYFLEYLNRVEELGGKVYLLEYTENTELIKEISNYCKEKEWMYYISDSIELN